MSPQFWRAVESIGYIFSTVCMVAFGLGIVFLMGKFTRELRSSLRVLSSLSLAVNLTHVQTSENGITAFCPTCKSRTPQVYLPATGRALTAKCTGCGNTRPL